MNKIISNPIFNFLKKNIAIVCTVIVAVAVLAVAFFAGGSLDTNTSVPASASADTVAYSDNPTTSVALDSETTYSVSNSEESTAVTNAETTVPETSVSKAETEEIISAATASSSQKASSSSKVSSTSSDKQKATSVSSAQSTTTAEKDKYLTDPVPSGKPEPVEPQEQEIVSNELTCTFSISCATILDNMDSLNPDKVELVPDDGWILKPQKVTFNEGESVYDVLVRICKDNNIHLESSFTPMYNSAYIEGINNLYEFDCGSLSGWMYSVNDWFPNYGCSRYELKQGDVVEWEYTCSLGYDIGGGYSVGE